MRIVISNPDSLGDVMLREPLFSAVHEAGHELMLVVRDFVAPLTMDIAPYARIAVCAGDPYRPNFVLGSSLDGEMVKQVDRFAPDLLVVASYQFTELEQQLAARFPGAEVVGFSGYLVQPTPNVVSPSTISFRTRVQVSTETPEPTKNELLCSAILGERVSLRAPRLRPTEIGRTLSANHLKKIGLNDTPFWAVCAGDRPPMGLKNWEREKWIEMCRTLIERHNIRILFIGTPEEDADTKAIQAGLGLAARQTASITAEPISISELVGLLDAAQGYIGKDTGPMHLAAALGKPVVAVFGGGHWPRFVPQAETGAVFSVDVPCKGCNWVCRLQRSHCVKDIPVAPVLDVVEKLTKGEQAPFRVELLPREGLLEAEMFREMYEMAQSAYQLLDTERANFTQWHDDRLRDIEALKARVENAKLEGAAETRAGIAAEVEALVESRIHAAGEEAAHRVRALETEVVVLTQVSRDAREERGALTRQLAEARSQIDKLETGTAKLEKERDQLHDQVKRLEQTSTELGLRLARAEAGKADAEQAVFELESELAQNLVNTAKLQAEIDTIESRHLGRIADLENSLGLQKRENQVALALIPELRTELISAQGQVAGWCTNVREFAARFGVTGNNTRGLLESVADRLQSAESQAAEFADTVRSMAGERAMGGDWREDLRAVQALLAEANGGWHAAQREVDDFTRQLQAASGAQADTYWRAGFSIIENDRVRRGEQIESLHQHIAHLAVEKEAQMNRVPIRLLRTLHIL